jgi:TIR domain
MPGGPAGYDVFLSYSRADGVAASHLRSLLADAGLKAFLDRYALPGGKPWQPELEAALGSCHALVVLLGPAGIGS